MFENFNLGRIFRKIGKSEPKELESGPRDSKETAKERLHMVLMQDRANVSADFLELMKQEIIDVIKKYIEVDEETIDVRLTTKTNEDGSNGTPALYANIPILNIRNDMKVENYKFALQSDGSIIAQKIEEPKVEVEEKEIDLDSIAIEEDNNDESDIVAIEVTDEIVVDDEKNIESVIDALDASIDEIEDNVEEVDETARMEQAVSEENITEVENASSINRILPSMEDLERLNAIQNSTEQEEPKEDVKEASVESIEKAEAINEQPVVVLKKSARRGRPKKKEKVVERKIKKVQKVDEKRSSEEDEEDDDVTFDDLLKAAEEADRKIAEQEKKEEK